MLVVLGVHTLHTPSLVFSLIFFSSFPEENLKQSSSLNEHVFGALEKMEVLQNQRARRWGDRMDQLASERGRLVQLMTSTFEKIEEDTGIFLIKPVYSYKSRHAALL